MPGNLLDATTQQWVKLTGKRIDIAEVPWLDGPTGGSFIGDTWLEQYAASQQAVVISGGKFGLIEDMRVLNSDRFRSEDLHPEIVAFYEETARWDLQLWSRWSPLFLPVGVVLSSLFSRRLQQLNLPLNSLTVSRGMSSEVKPVVDRSGQLLGTAWTRRLRSTDDLVFGGFYGIATLPVGQEPAVRVTFPLPNGHLSVFLRPENAEGGGLSLVSDGSAFGDVGAYLLVKSEANVSARRIPLPERFDVFVDERGILRANHVLRLRKSKVLEMHYRLDREEDNGH